VGAWFSRVVIGELFLAQKMARLETLLFLDWDHTELEQVNDLALLLHLQKRELDYVKYLSKSVSGLLTVATFGKNFPS